MGSKDVCGESASLDHSEMSQFVYSVADIGVCGTAALPCRITRRRVCRITGDRCVRWVTYRNPVKFYRLSAAS